MCTYSPVFLIYLELHLEETRHQVKCMVRETKNKKGEKDLAHI